MLVIIKRILTLHMTGSKQVVDVVRISHVAPTKNIETINLYVIVANNFSVPRL